VSTVQPTALPIVLAPEVEEALAHGRAVVALESTIVAHGLPRPRNLEVARELERLVRDGGAVPATIAVLDGQVRVGLDGAGLERLASDPAVAKVSVRDLPPLLARGGDGATTVASTALLAHRAGIRVFATGGLGGVHRGASSTFDESADLPVLAETPIVVVSAGVKSILDVPATLERLETLGITLVGYGTDRFPGFTLTDSGEPVSWRVDTPQQVAAVRRHADTLGLAAAVLVANPIGVEHELDRALHDRALTQALAEADAAGLSGKEVTPFLLDAMQRLTDGASLEANVHAVRGNVALAARIAVALAGSGQD
jgi:pseudouridine-5'-phosphate glycosidase